MSEQRDPHGPSPMPAAPKPTAAEPVPGEPATGSTARERVRRRMLALAPLCVVAAAPLTNAACDPAPDPYCSQATPEVQRQSLYADARWIAEGGTPRVELDLSLSGVYPLVLGESFSVVGGTLEQRSPVGSGVALTIQPDPGASELRVSGTLNCQGSGTAFTAILALSTPAEAGVAIPTTIQ
jgi:hypothetical protein